MDFFIEVFGAPTSKSDAIASMIKKYQILSKDAVMIGDSKTDMIAALNNNIDFVLRKTNENKLLQIETDYKMIDNFL